MSYVYQPEEKVPEFEDAYKLLRERFGERVTDEILDLDREAPQVRRMLSPRGIQVRDFNPNLEEFRSYCDKANYSALSWDYYGKYQIEKRVEHSRVSNSCGCRRTM